MELSLNQQYLNYYETVLVRTFTHEETMEAIVPDAKPDILSVADTEGQANLKAKQAQEGRCELAGVIGLAVVYLPDGVMGLQRMDANIPFTAAFDDGAISGAARLAAEPRVVRAETRLLNPRKILVRVEISIVLQVFMPRSTAICAQAEAEPALGLEQRSSTESAYLMTAVEEKAFSISEDLMIPGSRPAAVSVLKFRSSLLSGESKLIGNKLVFKGELLLQVVYVCAEGGMEQIPFTLPFSQIMEINGTGDETDTNVCIYQTEAECRVSGEDGRTLQFSIGLIGQVTVSEKRSYPMLRDIYSTEQLLETEEKAYRFARLMERGERTQNLREIIETPVLPVQVMDVYTTTGPVQQSQEGNQLVSTCDVTAHLLYEGDDGGVHQISQDFQVSQTLEGGAGSSCQASFRVVGEVVAVPVAVGIEVRILLTFSYETLASRTCIAVCDVRLAGERERGSSQPSLVLRSVAEESLWDIAKHYGITRQDVIQANDLDSEEQLCGKILLIPQRR